MLHNRMEFLGHHIFKEFYFYYSLVCLVHAFEEKVKPVTEVEVIHLSSHAFKL